MVIMPLISKPLLFMSLNIVSPKRMLKIEHISQLLQLILKYP